MPGNGSIDFPDIVPFDDLRGRLDRLLQAEPLKVPREWLSEQPLVAEGGVDKPTLVNVGKEFN
jgi:hypothetical protein